MRFAIIAAVGFFASIYPVVHAGFDVGRVDMLYLFFVLATFYATRRMNPVVAGLLWVCAFQTKQRVLPIAVLMLCYDWHHPRRIFTGIATFVVGEDQVRSIPGNVLVFSHPEDGLLTGKPLFAGSESVGSVIEARRQEPGDLLLAQYGMLLHS